jgi:hypothetical protein
VLYGFHNTIFINNFSLRRDKVSREIFEFGLFGNEMLDDSLDLLDWSSLETIFSPRIRRDGSVYYLSSENVSWCYLLNESDFYEEILFLKMNKLKENFDYAIVPIDISTSIFICPWIKLENEQKVQENLIVRKFSVIQEKLFRGYSSNVFVKN